MTTRALLLDFDDTLVPEWPALRAAYAAVAERVWGANAGDADRISALQGAARAVWRAGRPEQYTHQMSLATGEGLYGEFIGENPGAIALRAFVPRLHAIAFDAALPPGWQGRSPELVAIWREALLPATAPYPETLSVLDRWRTRMPLVLVTNGTSVLQRAKVAAAGFGGEFFAAVIVAEEVGAGKPTAAMFEAALAAIEMKPADVAMVGNDFDRDVAGARALGIRAIHLRRGASPDELGPEEIGDLRALERVLAQT